MKISSASPIRFKEVSTDIENFTNRIGCERVVRARKVHEVRQYLRKGEIIYVQIVVATGNVGGMTLNSYLTANSTSLVATANGYDIHEFVIEATAVTSGTQLEFSEVTGAGTVYYKSEFIQIYDRTEIEMENKGFLKIEWKHTGINYFYDYSTARTNFMWLKGRMIDYKPSGEATIFNSLQDTIKLQEQIKRTWKLEVFGINQGIAETVAVAMSHEYFTVNYKQYVNEELPEVIPLSNIMNLKVVLTQSFADGLNSLGTEPVTNPTNNYMLVNLTPIVYIPTPTGNTSNLNEFVITSAGDQYAIDVNGQSTLLQGSGGFQNFEVFSTFTGATNTVTLSSGSLPTTDQAKRIKVVNNGSVYSYEGAASTKKVTYGQVGNTINFLDNIRTGSVVVLFW